MFRILDRTMSTVLFCWSEKMNASNRFYATDYAGA